MCCNVYLRALNLYYNALIRIRRYLFEKFANLLCILWPLEEMSKTRIGNMLIPYFALRSIANASIISFGITIHVAKLNGNQ